MASITARTPERVGNWIRRILRIWPDASVHVEKVGNDYKMNVSGATQRELDVMVASEYYRGD